MCASQATWKYSFVSLDDLEAKAIAQNDPNAFFKKYKHPLIIDEIQYAPQLLGQIKIIVDRTRKPGLFWLTGSQKFTLMKGIQESLAGRIAILDLLGFSQAELSGHALNVKPFLPTSTWLQSIKKQHISISIMEIYKRIWLGSFPQLNQNIFRSKKTSNKNLISKKSLEFTTNTLQERNLFYESYVRTYLQRDIRDVLNITNENSFLLFLRAIAARTGQLLNYSEVARDIDIDYKTVKAWVSVLETIGLIYLLHPYHTNITKRLIKTPKVYFLDTGLCCYLTRWPDHKTLESGLMAGPILETYVFSEILKSYWHNGLNPYIYYYRDKDKKEIDILIEEAGCLYPIECKKTATPSYKITSHFKLVNKLDKKVKDGAVICLIDKDIPLSKNTIAIPVSYL